MKVPLLPIGLPLVVSTALLSLTTAATFAGPATQPTATLSSPSTRPALPRDKTNLDACYNAFVRSIGFVPRLDESLLTDDQFRTAVEINERLANPKPTDAQIEKQLDVMEKQWRDKSKAPPSVPFGRTQLRPAAEGILKTVGAPEDRKAGSDLYAAQAAALYQKMLDSHLIPADLPICMVLIPFPCPNRETYEEALAFTEKAAALAKPGQREIIVVNGLYSKKTPRNAQHYWTKEMEDLPSHLGKAAVNQGVQVIGELPYFKTTPSGLVFHNGKLAAQAHLRTNATSPNTTTSPQSLLNAFLTEKPQPK